MPFGGRQRATTFSGGVPRYSIPEGGGLAAIAAAAAAASRPASPGSDMETESVKSGGSGGEGSARTENPASKSREYHCKAERQRRAKQGAGVDDLRELIGSVENESLAKTLERAAEHIEMLKAADRMYERRRREQSGAPLSQSLPAPDLKEIDWTSGPWPEPEVIRGFNSPRLPES